MDDAIYEHLQKDFPEFDPAVRIDEDEMKSKTGKERWRKFLMVYEKKVDDYNFGTMLRAGADHEYSEKETIFGKKIDGRVMNVANLALHSSADAVLCYRDCEKQEGSE